MPETTYSHVSDAVIDAVAANIEDTNSETISKSNGLSQRALSKKAVHSLW